MRIPGAAGVKVTLTEHSPPAATAAEQVFVALKSAGFAPAITTLATVNGADPVLLTVIVCTAL